MFLVSPPTLDGYYQDNLADSSDQRELNLRLTTFNLLAPCYKRIHPEIPAAAMTATGTGLLASQARKHYTPRESEFDGLWRERAVQTVRPLVSDVVL